MPIAAQPAMPVMPITSDREVNLLVIKADRYKAL